MTNAKLKLWEDFVQTHDVIGRSAPLFMEAADGRVETFVYGKNRRLLLRRSPAMDDLVIATVNTCLSASSDGLLYMMFRAGTDTPVVPLYIGRAGRVGRKGGLSDNLRRIETNRANFARWGYNYAYHMGDLSAVVLNHHGQKLQKKYQSWGAALFEECPNPEPRLRQPIRFWCTEWSGRSANIWPEFGPCSLSFIEYLLIGVASTLFPNDLLNREGVNARDDSSGG